MMVHSTFSLEWLVEIFAISKLIGRTLACGGLSHSWGYFSAVDVAVELVHL